jgi:hypothetical protein
VNRTHPGGEKEDIYVTAVSILQGETGVRDTWRGIEIDREPPERCVGGLRPRMTGVAHCAIG